VGLDLRPQGRRPKPDDQAWTDISDLLKTTLTPPKLTAALFQVAATIPGATVVPHARDAAGQAGIAVARLTQASTEDDELIFTARPHLPLPRWAHQAHRP
jgi:hypothetical protein